jgi:hypothetical protein
MLSRSARFKIADFDQIAAIETAVSIRHSLAAGEKRAGSTASWAKVKFDRQIVAIAKVQGATAIYSDDSDIQRYGRAAGFDVLGTIDLPLPADDTQIALDFAVPDSLEE